MNILLVIARFEFGGIPNQAYLWYKFLEKKGLNPIIVAPHFSKNSFTNYLEKEGVQYGSLNVSYKQHGFIPTIRYFRALINGIERFDPDIIFPFNKELGYQINLVWRLTKAEKSFFMERNDGRDFSDKFNARMMRFISLFNSTGIIYNSEFAGKKTLFPKKTVIIKNTVYKKEINTNEISDLLSLVNKSGLVFLHVANIVAQKNYRLLIDGWKKIKTKFPESTLIVIGSPLLNRSAKEYNDLKILDGIILIESTDHVQYFIQLADICLLSSHYEGCPNVILEYVINRKLVCASNIPAIREVLHQSNYPYLFDNDSTLDFSEKIEELINLPCVEKEIIIDNNFKKLRSDYSEANYMKILDLINE